MTDVRRNSGDEMVRCMREARTTESAERAEEHQRDDEAGGRGLRPQHGQVRLDRDRADDFTVENDGTSQQQRSVGELTPLVMGLDLERHGREDPLHARVGGSLESSELIAILGPDRRRDDACRSPTGL